MNFNYTINQWKLQLIKRFPKLNKVISGNTGYLREELKATDYTLLGGQLNKKIL